MAYAKGSSGCCKRRMFMAVALAGVALVASMGATAQTAAPVRVDRADGSAVLVNELGRISIDTQLIVSRGGDVLELAGGCVCCKVDTKNDLWDGGRDTSPRGRARPAVF